MARIRAQREPVISPAGTGTDYGRPRRVSRSSCCEHRYAASIAVRRAPWVPRAPLARDGQRIGRPFGSDRGKKRGVQPWGGEPAREEDSFVSLGTGIGPSVRTVGEGGVRNLGGCCARSGGMAPRSPEAGIPLPGARGSGTGEPQGSLPV
jgi:hypothetical protein